MSTTKQKIVVDKTKRRLNDYLEASANTSNANIQTQNKTNDPILNISQKKILFNKDKETIPKKVSIPEMRLEKRSAARVSKQTMSFSS